MRPVHKYEADEQGLRVEKDDPTGQMVTVTNAKTGKTEQVVLQPDQGWNYNPAKAQWKPDLKKYPDELKGHYLKDVAEQKKKAA